MDNTPLPTNASETTAVFFRNREGANAERRVSGNKSTKYLPKALRAMPPYSALLFTELFPLHEQPKISPGI